MSYFFCSCTYIQACVEECIYQWQSTTGVFYPLCLPCLVGAVPFLHSSHKLLLRPLQSGFYVYNSMKEYQSSSTCPPPPSWFSDLTFRPLNCLWIGWEDILSYLLSSDKMTTLRAPWNGEHSWGEFPDVTETYHDTPLAVHLIIVEQLSPSPE